MKKDVTITKENFEEEVLKSDLPVWVDFFATWCGPCQMLSPILDEIAEENNDFYVTKVNTDEEPELAVAYGVANLPTVMVFKNGEISKKMVGYKTKEEILATLK